MFNKRTVTCIIPARGGSQGILRKNLRVLMGKSLLAHAIGKAQRCSLCDQIIVSTEDEQILEEARLYGVRSDYVRPAELATDTATIEDTVEHLCCWLKERDQETDLVLLLHPTSPLVLPIHIRNAFQCMAQADAEMVISVCKTTAPLGVCKPIRDFSMNGFLTPSEYNKRRQDLDVMFQLNGAIFAGNWDIFAQKKNFYQQKTIAYIMPKLHSVDINDLDDFKMAEYIIQGLTHEKPLKNSQSLTKFVRLLNGGKYGRKGRSNPSLPPHGRH